MRHPGPLRLQAYRDGQLSGKKLHPLERHLARCPRCQEALRGLDATGQLLIDACPARVQMSLPAAEALFLRAIEEAGAPIHTVEGRPGGRRDSPRPSLRAPIRAVALATLAALGIAVWQVSPRTPKQLVRPLFTPPALALPMLPGAVAFASAGVAPRLSHQVRPTAPKSSRPLATLPIPPAVALPPPAPVDSTPHAWAAPAAPIPDANASGSLLVSVTSPPNVDPQEGFAQAASYQPSPYGGGTWTAYLVSSEDPEPQVSMLRVELCAPDADAGPAPPGPVLSQENQPDASSENDPGRRDSNAGGAALDGGEQNSESPSHDH